MMVWLVLHHLVIYLGVSQLGAKEYINPPHGDAAAASTTALPKQ